VLTVTLRLYHRDAYLRAFEAEVSAVRGPDAGGPAVALAETAFYPEAGGQPPDWGELAGLAVRDVRDEEGTIWHHVPDAATLPSPGVRVRGVIDWDRRFDHMQQHTGQHILSQAFLQTLAAQTLSVHMVSTCTLDVDLPSVDADALLRVEHLATAIVMENRPVTTREVSPEEAEALGLRRPPKQTGRIRVVEVEGFDRSACGGTHVRASGEVGPIVIRGAERYKGGVRVEFLCGWRALRDYRRSRGLLRDLAGQFTVGEAELGDAVARLRARTRDLERALTDARAELLRHEAEALLQAAPPAPPGSPAVVAAAFRGRPIDELRLLARALTERASAVVVFATEPDRRVLIARSPSVAADAAAMLREALAVFNGRGGGKPEAAEGIAAHAPSAQAVVDAGRAAVIRHLARAPGTTSS
jgi:alanyl-tRNA synthetase